ncbi:MAG TPA: diacylglycerol kinase family protein [Ohtaekwangia sp.]|uniref:diacylglycerol kinase family protein n=1 Tax=Ohtaekwangia sp. TaxID=2066019 RepID=UPI002F935642
MMRAFLKSFVYAWQGIIVALREQRNLKIHVAVAILVIAAGIYYPVTRTEWCVLLLCIALVISLELINSSIENLVDLVTKEHHPLAGRVKDIAAGAVLVASIMAFFIGLMIFIPHILS